MNKIALIDLETTGLSPEKHEIIEIGCVLFNPYTPKDPETFEVKVHPTDLASADSEALRINGYKKEDWEDAFTLRNALMLLNGFVGHDVYFMSYNVTFDWAFVEKAYTKVGIPDPFHYHRLDLLTLAWDRLPSGAFLSLKKVCQQLGIEPEPNIHRALGGAVSAYQVFQKIKK